MTVRATFESKTMYAGDCIVWIGAFSSNGYGSLRGGERSTVWAHRVAYERSHGAIPAGYQVDHICRNRACVNVGHLRLLSSRDNTHAHGSLSPAHLQSLRTHCVHGHELAGANCYLRTRKSGVSRQCVACARIREKQYRSAGRCVQA